MIVFLSMTACYASTVSTYLLARFGCYAITRLWTSLHILFWNGFEGGGGCNNVLGVCLYMILFLLAHLAGQFTGELRRGREVIQAHTGTIDQVWTGCKAFIPKQLGSQSELIEVYLRRVPMEVCQSQHSNSHEDNQPAQLAAKVKKKTKCAVCVVMGVIGKTTLKKTCTAPQREGKIKIKPL